MRILHKSPADGLIDSFGARFPQTLLQWRDRIDELRRHCRRVVIWGAGSKGVMFPNLLGVPAGAGIDWVVDVNPRKHGHFVPLTGQRIVAPHPLLENPPDLAVVMNQEYYLEDRSMIDHLHIDS